MNTIKKRTISSILILSLVFSLFLGCIDVSAATTSKTPSTVKSVSTSASGKTITIKWGKTANAKQYQVAKRSDSKSWVYIKKVKKTKANKKKYTKAKKYKVKASGSKYKVYEYKYTYKVLKTLGSSARSYKYSASAYNTTYYLAVRGKNGSKYSKWATKGQKTGAKPSSSESSSNQGSNNSSSSGSSNTGSSSGSTGSSSGSSGSSSSSSSSESSSETAEETQFNTWLSLSTTPPSNAATREDSYTLRSTVIPKDDNCLPTLGIKATGTNAVAADKNAEASKTVTAKSNDATIPKTPSNINVTTTSKNVCITWDAVSGATGYEIYRSETSGTRGTKVYTSSQPKYCDTNIVEGKTYYYIIAAVSNSTASRSLYSEEVKSSVIPKSQVTDSHVTVTDTSITLTWDKPSDKYSYTDEELLKMARELIKTNPSRDIVEYGYYWEDGLIDTLRLEFPGKAYEYGVKVYRNDTKKALDNVTDNCRARYIDKNIESNKVYTYTLKEYFSVQMDFTTSGTPTTKDIDIPLETTTYTISTEKDTAGFSNSSVSLKPVAPKNLAVTARYDKVDLTWDKVDDASKYKIYKNGVLINTTANNDILSYTDGNVTPESNAKYEIRAVVAGSESISTTVNVKIPAKPELLSPSQFKLDSHYDKVVMSFMPNDLYRTIKVYRKEGFGARSLFKTIVATDSDVADGITITDDTSKANTKYTYSIVSVDSNGNESPASEITFTTPKEPVLLPPSQLTAQSNAINVTLKWPTNILDLNDSLVDGYVVYRNGTKIATFKRVAGKYNVYVDSNVKTGASYTYTVKSLSNGVESSSGATVKAVPIKKTTGVSFPADKNVKLNYNGTEIYLGETWSDTLNASLAKGTSGTAHIKREGFANVYLKDKYDYIVDEDIYMYDTGDYSDFLTVYVVNNQIYRWYTNSKNMGSSYGKSLTRMMDVADQSTRPQNAYCFFATKIDGASVLYIGGFKHLNNDNTKASVYINTGYFKFNEEDEKLLGFHLTNAYRMAYSEEKGLGLKPFTYNDDLDGKDRTFSGTVTYFGLNGVVQTETVTNVRYGAQPLAETQAESKRCGHETWHMKKGPLAKTCMGRNDSVTSAVLKAKGEEYTTGSRGYLNGENTGSTNDPTTGGECILTVYDDSGAHRSLIVSSMATRIGIGFAINQNEKSFTIYHAERYI